MNMDVNLGRSVATHRGTFAAGGLSWYLGGIFTAAGAVALVSCLKPGTGEGRLTEALFGGGALLVGLLVLLGAYIQYRQVVEVFEQGFVWTKLTGKRSVSRNTITKCELLTTNNRGTSLTQVNLTLADGDELELAGLENPEQLANLLRPQVATSVSRPPGGTAPGGWRPPSA